MNVSLDLFDVYNVDDRAETFQAKMGWGAYWRDDWYRSTGMEDYFDGSLQNSTASYSIWSTASYRRYLLDQCTRMNLPEMYASAIRTRIASADIPGNVQGLYSKRCIHILFFVWAVVDGWIDGGLVVDWWR